MTLPGSPDLAVNASYDSVAAAAGTLHGIANRTPVLTSRSLDRELGCRVFFKCENYQRTGSFKFRGAFNAISRIPAVDRSRGVLTYSSGNHAQAVALAGRLLHAPVTVVMPDDAPEVKRVATEEYGAEIVLYDPHSQVREEVARDLLRRRPLKLVPPFDHPDVLSGQGTAALELIAEAGPLDLIFVPCGGGGLLSGTALAATSLPGCHVIGVEPALADDAARTFRMGTIQCVRNPATIADGLRTASIGRFTWPIIRSHVHDIRTVTEAEIVHAMRYLWTRMKIVIEPSGAVALAGLLADPASAAGRRVGILVSGGNVDLRSACDLLTGVAGSGGPTP